LRSATAGSIEPAFFEESRRLLPIFSAGKDPHPQRLTFVIKIYAGCCVIVPRLRQRPFPIPQRSENPKRFQLINAVADNWHGI
jgi:hypothetical protein